MNSDLLDKAHWLLIGLYEDAEYDYLKVRRRGTTEYAIYYRGSKESLSDSDIIALIRKKLRYNDWYVKADEFVNEITTLGGG